MVILALRTLDIEGFRKYLEVRVEQKSLSSGTVGTYMGALVQFNGWLKGREPERKICQDYVDGLTGGGKSNSTVATAAHAIKRYFRWKGMSVDLEYPAVQISKPKYISVDQVEMILDECRTHLERALVLLLYDAGARISEVTNIQIKDIDWEHKIIEVTRKGGNRGNIILQQDTLDAVASWMLVRKSNSDRLFMQMKEQDLSKILRHLGRKASIWVTPHMLRHSRALQMLLTGSDIYIVQQMLGHLDIRTTMNIYGKFSSRDLGKVIPDPFQKGKSTK